MAGQPKGEKGQDGRTLGMFVEMGVSGRGRGVGDESKRGETAEADNRIHSSALWNARRHHFEQSLKEKGNTMMESFVKEEER